MQAQLANDPDFQYLAVDRVKLLKEQTREFDYEMFLDRTRKGDLLIQETAQ
jgi:hypothetical protein